MSCVGKVWWVVASIQSLTFIGRDITYLYLCLCYNLTTCLSDLYRSYVVMYSADHHSENAYRSETREDLLNEPSYLSSISKQPEEAPVSVPHRLGHSDKSEGHQSNHKSLHKSSSAVIGQSDDRVDQSEESVISNISDVGSDYKDKSVTFSQTTTPDPGKFYCQVEKILHWGVCKRPTANLM